MAELQEPQQNEEITDLDRVRLSFLDRCSRETMATYIHVLEANRGSGLADLLRMVSMFSEFNFITVRDEETQELAALSKQLALSINEHLDPKGRGAKVNILLRAFIAQLKPEGLTLAQEMVKVGQTAGKLVRTIFEICLYKGWARLIDESLTLRKMVEERIWLSMSELRQVQELEVSEGDFPELKLAAHVQPVTRTMLQVKLIIEFGFQWNDEIHGDSQAFWVFVENVNNEVVLHSDYFLLEKKYREEEHVFNFVLPQSEPFHLRIVSDKWLAPETRHEVSVSDLIEPAESPPPTAVMQTRVPPDERLQPSCHEPQSFEALFTSSMPLHFNSIQTKVFTVLFETGLSVFVGAPMGSGKSVCAEFAILRLLKDSWRGRCVYVAPNQAKVDQMYKDWSERFGRLLPKPMVRLTGEATEDLRLLQEGFTMAMATAKQWDMLYRREGEEEGESVQNVDLFIMDDLHLIGGESGPVLEVVCSRMVHTMYNSSINNPWSPRPRIVALSSPVANPEDLCKWLCIGSGCQYNFPAPSARPVPLITQIQGYCQRDAPTRLGTMAAPVRSAVKSHLASGGPVLVFVPSWRQSLLTAQDLVKHGCTETVEGRPDRFLLCSPEDIAQQTALITDKTLREVVGSGVGFLHGGLPSVDHRVVEDLFAKRAIRVLVVSQSLIWSTICQANLVIIMDTQHFDGQQHRHIEYQVADVLQMVGLAEGSSSEDKCILMCQNSRKDYYKKVLSEPLPVESHLDGYIHSFLNAEIVTGTIRDKTEAVDCLNWTFMHRRMTQNPSYYNLQRGSDDDMSGDDLSNDDLSGDDLSNHDLSNDDLSGDDLSGDDVSNDDLSNDDLCNDDLSGDDLFNDDVFGDDLSNDDLSDDDYYSPPEQSNLFLSDRLFNLAVSTLKDLQNFEFIEIVQDYYTVPLDPGVIASHDYIDYRTIAQLCKFLTAVDISLDGIVAIVSLAAELQDPLPARHGENVKLEKLAKQINFKPTSERGFSDPQNKANLLLHTRVHMARVCESPELISDTECVLKKVTKLLPACVKIISSSHGSMQSALNAVLLCQLATRRVQLCDSVLMQLPHFAFPEASKCQEKGVTTIYQMINKLENEKEWVAIQAPELRLNNSQLQDVENFCKCYPAASVTYGIKTDKLESDATVLLHCTVQRKSALPPKREEVWWLMVEEKTTMRFGRTGNVVAAEQLTFHELSESSCKVLLPIACFPKEAAYELHLVCSSYRGCDSRLPIKLR